MPLKLIEIQHNQKEKLKLKKKKAAYTILMSDLNMYSSERKLRILWVITVNLLTKVVIQPNDSKESQSMSMPRIAKGLCDCSKTEKKKEKKKN